MTLACFGLLNWRFNPIYFIALIVSIRYYREYRKQDMQLLAIPMVLVFLLATSLFNLSEANWTMPAYISASLLLAHFFDKATYQLYPLAILF